MLTEDQMKHGSLATICHPFQALAKMMKRRSHPEYIYNHDSRSGKVLCVISNSLIKQTINERENCRNIKFSASRAGATVVDG